MREAAWNLIHTCYRERLNLPRHEKGNAMTVSIELQMEQMGQRAKKAARVLSAAAPAAKTQALRALAALLIERQPDILKANALDVHHGGYGRCLSACRRDG